jgi:hypothetical protein
MVSAAVSSQSLAYGLAADVRPGDTICHMLACGQPDLRSVTTDVDVVVGCNSVWTLGSYPRYKRSHNS